MSHKKITTIVFLLIFVLSLNCTVQAAVIVDFSLEEYTVDSPGGSPTSPIGGPFTAANEIDPSVVSAKVQGFGFGTGGSGSYAGELNYASWHGGDKRLQIEVIVENGMYVNLSSLTLNIVRNGSGAPEVVDIELATDGIVLDSIDGLVIRNGSQGAMPDTGFEKTFDLSSAPKKAGTVTMLVTSSDGKVGNLRINKIVVDGTIAVDTDPAVTKLLPDNNARQIELAPEMSWTSVNTVSPTYEVNIGTDTDCSDILIGHGVDGNENYTVSQGLLTWETTYYWRIDLWEGGVEYPGPVRSFKTRSAPKDYRVIDDFDMYINTAGLKAVWQQDSGADIAEDLSGTMKIIYNNQAPGWVSKVTRIFSPAANWALDDMAMMSFTIKGDDTNQGQILSVALDDGIDQATVEYADSTIITNDTWKEVYFKLNDFSVHGVDLSNIESITIKVGDGISPGGSGSIYVDDLTLYTARCTQEYSSPADINKDCLVNMIDLKELILCWLSNDSVIIASEPSSDYLQASYQFDETTGDIAHDSSENSFHASVESASWQTDGHDAGGSLQLTRDTVVTIPASVFNSIDQQLTVCFWIKASHDDLTGIYNQVFAGSGPVPVEEYIWDTIRLNIDNSELLNDRWHHCTIVKDSTQSLAAIYWDGILLSINNTANTVLDGSLAGDTILQSNAAYTFNESACLIDDLQIYDTALSQHEIVYLAKGESAQVIQPIYPIASPVDFDNSGQIDLYDFSILSAAWLAN